MEGGGVSTRSLAEHGITWDEDGTPRGFQIGKAAAMLDWEHRKEARAFEKLIARLRSRKWYSENRERARAAARARWKEKRVIYLAQMKAAYNAKCGPKPLRKCAECGADYRSRRKLQLCCSTRCRDRRARRVRRLKLAASRPPKLSATERRAAKLAAEPALTCSLCGREWRRTRPGQKRRRYCSDYCMERAKYLNSPRGQAVTRKRTGGIQRSILAACRDWRTHAEIRAATGLGSGTVCGTLARLTKQGRIEVREPRQYRATGAEA